MDKYELIGITLQQLIDHFKTSPESFEYCDQERKPNQTLYPTIFWQPKVQLGDCLSTVVRDPNNSHAVVVAWNHTLNELTCWIFLKAPPSMMNVNSVHTADCVMQSKRAFESWRSNYKKFKKLKNLILERDKQRENLTYLKKLSSVFPDSMDFHLLDK